MPYQITPIRFVSTELLFPTWVNARTMLARFIDQARHLEATMDEEYKNAIIQPTHLKRLEHMPDELRTTLNEVLNKTYEDYIPVEKMSQKFVNRKLCKGLLLAMDHELWIYECELSKRGYASYQERLLHCLGIVGSDKVMRGLLEE